MAPKIKDLGMWRVYTPDVMPEWTKDMPEGSRPIFVRRDSDGADWYEFRNDPASFTDGYLLAMTSEDPFSDRRIVQGVYRNKSATPVPTGLHLIEIEDINPADPAPWKQYEQRVYDLALMTIGDLWAPPVMSVRDYQFAGQAAAEGIISNDDALQWVTVGKIPQVLINAVKASVADEERQSRVLLFLAGTTAFPRFHELTPLLAASFGKDTPAKLDAFFLAASKR